MAETGTISMSENGHSVYVPTLVLISRSEQLVGMSDYATVASFPGPHVERGSGPGDTWQNSRMC